MIKFPNVPMKLEIIKFQDESLVGTLITTLEKVIKKNDSINYKDFSVLKKYNYYRNSTDVYDVFKLDDSIVNQVYYEILNEKLELLESCNHPFKIRRMKNEKFVPDCLWLLHGSYSVFNIKSLQITKSIDIQTFNIETINEDINNNSIDKLPEKQKKAQKMIFAINEKIDINKEFAIAQERIINLDDDYLYSFISKGFITSFLNTKKKK